MNTLVAHQALRDLKEADTKNNVAVSTKQRRHNLPRSETVLTSRPTRVITASNMHLPTATSTHQLAPGPANTCLYKIVPITSRRRDTTIMRTVADHRRPFIILSQSMSTCVSEAITANRVLTWVNTASQALCGTSLTTTRTCMKDLLTDTTAGQRSMCITKMERGTGRLSGEPCTSLRPSLWSHLLSVSKSRLPRLRLECQNRIATYGT